MIVCKINLGDKTLHVEIRRYNGYHKVGLLFSRRFRPIRSKQEGNINDFLDVIQKKRPDLMPIIYTRIHNDTSHLSAERAFCASLRLDKGADASWGVKRMEYILGDGSKYAKLMRIQFWTELGRFADELPKGQKEHLQKIFNQASQWIKEQESLESKDTNIASI